MSHKRNEALRHVQHSMHHVIAAGEGSDRAPDSCKLCPYYRPDFKFRTCLYAHCPYKKQVNVFRSTPEKWDILYFGMTEREEALLFAQQTGISERLSAGQKLRALIFAGEPAAVAFQQATELAGVHLSFEEGRGKQRISCIATAYHEFIRLGPELYIESLDVLLNAWNGEPDSMSSANLLGICRFVELYHSEYNKGRLIAKLRQVDAFTVFRLARTAGVNLPGKTKYLQQVYNIYNGGSRRAALPLKF